MKRASLASINRHLKETINSVKSPSPTVGVTGRSQGDSLPKKTHSKQKSGLPPKSISNSNKHLRKTSCNSQHSPSTKTNASTLLKVLESQMLNEKATPSIMKQGGRTYISSKGKATVNIFNFNNYSIIKNEKEKFIREDGSEDRRMNSNDNIQNFFMFCRKRDGKQINKVDSSASIPINPEQNLDSKSRNSSTRRTNNQQNTANARTRHAKQNSLNVQGSDRKLFQGSSTSLNRSYASNSSFRTLDVKLNKTRSGQQIGSSSAIQNMNSFLNIVHSHNKFVQWLKSVKVAYQTRKETQKSRPILGRSLMRRNSEIEIAQDPLEKTKDLIGNFLNELQTVEVPEKTSVPKRSESVGVNTKSKFPLTTDVVLSGTNFISLMKEQARCILVQSDRLNRKVADPEQFYKSILNKNWVEPQTATLFKKCIATFQEHLIFEEALRSLQEKNIALDQVFTYVYHRLGIVAKESKDQSLMDIQADFLNASEASFEESHRSSSCKELAESNARFSLDFDNLKYESSCEESIGHSAAN